MNEDKKVLYCKENCIGCDICCGCLEDGSKCEKAPSEETIQLEILKNS